MPMEPFPKRSRSEFDGSGLNPGFTAQPPPPVTKWEAVQQGNSEGWPYGSSRRFPQVSSDGKGVGQSTFSSGGKLKPCMKFFSTTSCSFGESCHFLHYVPGGLGSLGLAPIVSMPASTFTSQRKPAIAAADPNVTVNGYKTKLCNRFNTAEGCRFGDRCHFAHGEKELRLPNNMSQGNRGPVPNGLMGTSPVSNSSNPGYMVPPRDVSNLSSQGYAEPNPPGVSGSTDVSSSYQAQVGLVCENLQVFK